ncbi:Smr/MutS family protein [Haliangium ochraceum]|uniref:Smr protein/MutS2 n=1 Tax=Haliangium ochraceum (strain DSM 14365 / JCM 11303 / SMP-2) TaxID=502025 RepID=D0LJP8_HALO1|nr:Smr/MutS family protein [Haliangium ochraceum]ACY16622.1 Smr protein/MutS2 [Haliangium ochraceum DSM 14365]
MSRRKRPRGRRPGSGSGPGADPGNVGTDAPATPPEQRTQDPPAALSDAELMARAMADVQPLGDRERVHLPAPQPPPRARDRQALRIAAPPTLTIEGRSGYAPGVTARERGALAAGRRTVDLRIDLHGFRVDGARQTLHRRLEQAARAGKRCALVIHGRGHHSGGHSVLREAVIEALQQPPLVHLVLAFCPAIPLHGGDGAMYILLTRAR